MDVMCVAYDRAILQEIIVCQVWKYEVIKYLNVYDDCQ